VHARGVERKNFVAHVLLRRELLLLSKSGGAALVLGQCVIRDPLRWTESGARISPRASCCNARFGMATSCVLVANALLDIENEREP
jgi:hypothetical protein